MHGNAQLIFWLQGVETYLDAQDHLSCVVITMRSCLLCFSAERYDVVGSAMLYLPSLVTWLVNLDA